MRLNREPEKLKVGQSVTSDFVYGSERVVRKILKLVRDAKYGSGFRAVVDGGGKCHACKRAFSEGTGWIDAAWLIPVRKRAANPGAAKPEEGAK